MTTRRSILAAALILASTATPAEENLDPVVVSPDKYSVLLENEQVRVVEYRVEPGERDNWHTHPPKVAYVVEGGRLRITTGTGESFVVHEQSGATRWQDSLGRHYGENVGDTPVHIVFVEVKAAPGVAEDLGKFMDE